ncbi:uncharacterized protein LOC139920315 [Centroberyx gerrardi]
MAPRKRSVVWHFFKAIDEDGVQCLLCKGCLIHKGRTTGMLRHLRIKHPVEFAGADLSERQECEMTDSVDRHIGTDGDQYCSVEVALEDGDSDCIATVNGAEITCAISGILEAAEEVAVKQRKQEASGDGRSTRKRSLIWKHYERLENQNCALCLLCMKKIQHNSNTSNLHRHLAKIHPEATELGEIKKPKPSNTLQHSPVKVKDTAKLSDIIVVKEKCSDKHKVSRVPEGEMRVLERERELIEALRNAQKQEARALEHQRELLEMLRAANAREAAAERERIESLRRAQEEEARDLSRQRQELQKERAELLTKWEEFNLLSGGQQAN